MSMYLVLVKKITIILQHEQQSVVITINTYYKIIKEWINQLQFKINSYKISFLNRCKLSQKW